MVPTRRLDKDFEKLKAYAPKKAASMFINYYLSNFNKEGMTSSIDKLADALSQEGREKIMGIYRHMQQELKYNMGIENYTMVRNLQDMMDYYRKNVIYKSQEK